MSLLFFIIPRLFLAGFCGGLGLLFGVALSLATGVSIYLLGIGGFVVFTASAFFFICLCSLGESLNRI